MEKEIEINRSFIEYITDKLDMDLVTEHTDNHFAMLKFRKLTDKYNTTEQERLKLHLEFIKNVEEISKRSIIKYFSYEINEDEFTLTIIMTKDSIRDTNLKYMKKLNIN